MNRVEIVKRATVAILFTAALVLPLLSLSDDLGDRDVTKAFAAVLVAVAVMFSLTAIARIATRADQRVSFVLAKHADPRSPPQR